MFKKIAINLAIIIAGALSSLGILKSLESTGLSGLQFSCKASALDEKDQSVFSQNDITFYDPTCTTSGGGPAADTSFKIDESTSASDFWYAEGCLTDCISGHYAHTKFDTANDDIPRTDTKTDGDFGGMQYIYAENYDFDLNSWPRKMTRKSDASSTKKYYWIVLPDQAYSNGPGETYVATFEKLSEPVYFITFDVHACEHQSEDYCGKASADPNGVKAGKEFLGAITQNGGNYSGIVEKAGKLTSLHRINGAGEVTAKEFKISGSTIGSTGSTSLGTSASSYGTAKWNDGWLEEGSITGAIKEDVNGKNDLSEKAYKDGDYSTGGKPNKILLHYTEGTSSGYAAYPAGNKYPAHFTIDAKNKKIVQAFSLNQPALAIKSHDDAAGIQIEIVSLGYDDYSKYTDDEWDYIATLLVAISEATGIPLTSSVEWSGTPARLSTNAFNNYEGVLGHMHAPDNDHGDPGDIWKFLEPAIRRVQSGNCNSYSGDYPQYFQGNFEQSDHGSDTHDWTGDPYSEGTMSSSGCGPSSMAMLATVASGQDVYPHDVVDITKPGNYAKSGETGFVDFDKKVGEKYGFEVEEVTFSSMDDAVKKIKEYADKGYMAHFSGQGCTISPSCNSHYVGIFEVKGDQAFLADSASRGNRWVDLASYVKSGIKKGRFTAIKKGGNKNTCTDLCNDEGNTSQANGDILSAVEYIIALANKNGSTYMYGGHRSISDFDNMLNNDSPIDTDCTGFASLVYYKAYGSSFTASDIFSSESIYTNSHYQKINREDVQPGDIAAASNYHGVVVIEVEDGKVTKIAETGGTGGRSGNNNNIGYSSASDYTVKDINGGGSHTYNFFRWKGAN